VAVCAGRERITYGELDARANRLAHALRRQGVARDVLVGCCLDRGIELIVGILGILKAGGAYLPIDPAYPERRNAFLLADSGAKLVVTAARTAACLEGSGAIRVDIESTSGEPAASPGVAADPGQLAYVIYTSGSTGTPKGVAVEHGHVVRLFGSTRGWFGFDERDVWSSTHSVSFDFSVWEIWGALLHGARLVIAPVDVMRTPDALHTLLREAGVTMLSQTPSAFRQLVAADLRREPARDFALRHIVFGGEALDLKLLRPWIERYGDERPQLVNMYGITETTVHVTYKRIVEADLRRAPASLIGVPIPDLRVELLDAAGQAVPDGTPGEIHVAGAGLARGYLHRPELTAERFITTASGERLYRSGDRAMRTPDGELVYLGRIDDQMKIRGFRIEPREIEACLAAHQGVAEAVVVPRDYGDGDVRLVAYLVPAAGAAGDERLRDAVTALAESELPAHMRPSRYRFIEDVPLTPQGKADRAALSALPDEPAPAVSTPAESRTETEQAIAGIVEEILQLGGISVHDDLFDLGATSLTITRIMLRVNQYSGVALNGSELVDEASIARLAACVDRDVETRRQGAIGGQR
jgi:amino acid adenylation domain-containing protein